MRRSRGSLQLAAIALLAPSWLAPFPLATPALAAEQPVRLGLDRACTELRPERRFSIAVADASDEAPGRPGREPRRRPGLFGAVQPPARPGIDPPGPGQTAQSSSLQVRLRRDLVDLLTLPRRATARQWRRLGYVTLAVGAISLLDEDLRSVVRRDRSKTSEEWALRIRPLGQEGGLVLLGAFWLAGQSTGREGLAAVGKDGLEAVLLSSGLITPLLKATVGRARPRTGANNSTFIPGAESFPSGEVTQAFTIASVVAAHSQKRWVDGVAWGLAGAISWQRMRLDAHWASDVAAGALIGTAVGRWVVRRNRPELAERPAWSLAPIVAQHGFGANLTWRF